LFHLPPRFKGCAGIRSGGKLLKPGIFSPKGFPHGGEKLRAVSRELRDLSFNRKECKGYATKRKECSFISLRFFFAPPRLGICG
jgi:hypothetical protein